MSFPNWKNGLKAGHKEGSKMSKTLEDFRDDLAHDIVTLLNTHTFFGHVLTPIEKVVDPR